MSYSLRIYNYTIKNIQKKKKKTTKMVKDLQGKTYKEWLKSLGLFRPEKWRLIVAYSFLRRKEEG